MFSLPVRAFSMATIQVGVLMNILGTEEFRTYGEPDPPKPPRPPLRENKMFRIMTFGVLVLSILWIIGIDAFKLQPSKLTITGLLLCLMFYSGEYIGWQRPKLSSRPRRRKGRHSPWIDR
jgi:hypothetical protein